MQLPKRGRMYSKKFRCRGKSSPLDTWDLKYKGRFSILNTGSGVEIQAKSSVKSNRTNNFSNHSEIRFDVEKEGLKNLISAVKEFNNKSTVDHLSQLLLDAERIRADSDSASTLKIRLENFLKIQATKGGEIIEEVKLPLSSRKKPAGFENTENLQDFLDFLNQFVSGFSSKESADMTELKSIISMETRGKISDFKYGEEILKHLRDGDSCLKLGYNHSALSSYIHAIEWSLISVLKENEDKDIIKEEKEGSLYYFAGKNPNLVDKVDEKVGLDQKTHSKLKEINRVQRRWSAHHKSGQINEADLRSLRSRIQSLVLLHDDLK